MATYMCHGDNVMVLILRTYLILSSSWRKNDTHQLGLKGVTFVRCFPGALKPKYIYMGCSLSLLPLTITCIVTSQSCNPSSYVYITHMHCNGPHSCLCARECVIICRVAPWPRQLNEAQGGRYNAYAKLNVYHNRWGSWMRLRVGGTTHMPN